MPAEIGVVRRATPQIESFVPQIGVVLPHIGPKPIIFADKTPMCGTGPVMCGIGQ